MPVVNIDNFIEGQYRKFFQGMSYQESNQEYADLYKSVSNQRMRELFTVIHSDLIGLFNLMNERLPTDDNGNHYWADPSRDLIRVIEVVFTLQRQLENTEYAFKIDSYYNDLLHDCCQWLSKSGGSAIPPHMESVTLYYLKPIFITEGVLPYQELHALGEENELLGRGGFGEVYKYRHPVVDIDFAVKIFAPKFATDEDRQSAERRFFREAKILFQLDHPNIVRIYDVGRIQGNPFIKIEYVEGKTLEKVRDQPGNFTFIPAAKATIQILSGLQHAHDCGIIHRDLKPSNVMVQMDEDRWTCKLIDFGISAFMDTEGYTKLTKTGEQVAGGNFIDPLLSIDPSLRDVRSDIYSTGAIFYYLLCGRPPVGADAITR